MFLRLIGFYNRQGEKAMLVTLVPLFDENMVVRAYSLFTRKENLFLNPRLLGTGENDGAANVEALDLIKNLGLNTVSEDKEVFVPVNSISVFAALEEQFAVYNDKVVFLIDNTIPTEEKYIKRLLDLKKSGYKLAMRKLEVKQYQQYEEILKMVDYMFLDHKKINISSARIFFAKMYPQIKLCAGNIDTQESFQKLKAEGGYQFYEGRFYRVPVTKGEYEVTPLKVNYIELINMVNTENYELTEAAEIIARDTALAIDLLTAVNKYARNSEIISIKYAAAMLGQKELKRWINMVVAKKLYSNKPNEITRLSLLRAKFAENLASVFELSIKKQELFLMGLFSVLDLIMDKPMEEALELIKVSKEIKEVLVNAEGPFAEVYEFIKKYEAAEWQEISRVMVVKDIKIQDVYDAYIGALEWYGDLFVE